MTEINMHRIGLKLVFAAALTLLLVSSVHQQWNSAKQKMAREIPTSVESDSTNREKRDERVASLEDLLTFGDKTDRVDTRDTLETKAIDGNSENVSAIESELGEETEVNAYDEEDEYGTGINISNGEENEKEGKPPTSTSTSFTGENTGNNATHASGKNEDGAPVYEDGNEHDPHWRGSKFADALYDDEEDDDSYKNDDEQASDTDVKENDIVDLKQPGNTGSKESSMLSWLRLGKYLTFENNPVLPQNQDESQVYSNDENTFDIKPTDGELNQIYDPNVNHSFSTDNEYISISIGNKTATEFTDVSESKVDINQNLENDFEKHQDETQNLQKIPTDKKSPVDINGIDQANYDDFDDIGENEFEEPEEKFTELGHQIEHSQTEIIKNTPNLGVVGIDSGETAAQEAFVGLRPWEHERETILMGAAQAQRPYIPQIIQPYPQQIQSLLYQQQQRPLLTQLTQRQQLFKAFLPPRIVDLILSEKFETSQLPARLQYYIQQKIHRIDQDFDPLTNSETKHIVSGQAQFPASTTFNENEHLISTFPLTTDPKNDETENHESEDVEEVDENKTYEVDNYDSTTNIDESDNYDNNYGNDKDIADVPNDQDKIYTQPPDTAVYDNPRPLSETEFALYRTNPYNARHVATNYISNSPADVKYDANNNEAVGTGLPARQLSKSWTEQEDETISCPRQIGLAKLSHPVTALVAFSDASTDWVRRILEQLTGTETDSIYNIMAQLKAGNAANVYQMGNKIAIETHVATDKNFDRALVVIRNPFAVDAQHRTFRPPSIDWQKSVLWNETFSTWLTSSLPLHVTTYEDLMERPLTELMKITDFVASPDLKISYKCAMKIALEPPSVINDISEITGIYQDDRRRINQNIDYLIQIAQKTHPGIVYRLNSYKLLTSSWN